MKLLLIGDPDSPFIREYVGHVAGRAPFMAVDLLNPHGTPGAAAARATEPGARVIEAGAAPRGEAGLGAKVQLARRILRLRRAVRGLGQYDVCHVHFAMPIVGFLVGALRRRCGRIVCTVWGSEFYRRAERSLLMDAMQRRLYRCARAITFANDRTRDDFLRAYGGRYAAKTSIVRFGLGVLDGLDGIRNQSKAACKQSFGLAPESLVIACGYNASPNQQHLAIIESLARVRDDLPRTAVVVLPLGYSGDAGYKASVAAAMARSGLPHRILDGFLRGEAIARFRKATDILVQVQRTDQLSGSMQEHLYARNVVITGAWLPYEPFYSRGVFMLTVPDVSSVGAAVLRAWREYEELEQRCAGNPGAIREMSSWERNIDSWLALYRGGGAAPGAAVGRRAERQ